MQKFSFRSSNILYDSRDQAKQGAEEDYDKRLGEIGRKFISDHCYTEY